MAQTKMSQVAAAAAQQLQQQQADESLTSATSTQDLALVQQATTTTTTNEITPKLHSIESTIIDIPITSASLTSLALSTSAAGCSSSSAYDTDSSMASSTCCTRHGEHIYMERIPTTQISPATLRQTTDVEALHYKADHKKSWPIFILVISIIEITIYVYDTMTSSSNASSMLTPQQTAADIPAVTIPTDSVFIYRPDRRLEVWRFISYMFLHANWFHLGFNVVVQLFYGIPLEVMHGSARVAIIYFAGVFAGSLGTSVVDSEVYLVGASGGVYALLAAHLANITLNYGQMKYAVAQLLSVVIFVSCDLGYAFYTQYLAVIELSNKTGAVGAATAVTTAPPVSYIAHLTGALAGLTIGLLVLKNFEHRAYENLIWWLALGIYSAFTVFAIIFNLINTMTAQMMEEQGEVITQHLLHDLGVS